MSRSVPPVHVQVQRSGVWLGGLIGLVLLATLSWGGWLLAQDFHELPEPPLFWLLGTLALGCVVIPLGLMQIEPVSLRWDSQAWYVGALSQTGVEPWSVVPVVCIDLGFWMLLSLRSSSVNFPASYRWLSVQQKGLESDWHLLRCVLYSSCSLSHPQAPID